MPLTDTLFPQKQDIYSLLSTNIKRQNITNPIQRMSVTSVCETLGRASVTEKLASQLAREKYKVLLIKADPMTRKGGLHGGLTHLLAQLMGRPITQGQLSDYGLLDLFFLIYLQGKSGQLVLKTNQSEIGEAYFHDGILCHLRTPTTDLAKALPYFKNYSYEFYSRLQETAQKKKQPLIDLLIKQKCFGRQELSFGYRSSLKQVFQELEQMPLVSFVFNKEKAKFWRGVPKLLNDQFALFDEKLREHHFISRCVRLNIHRKDNNLCYMLRGSHDVQFSHQKTYQEVQRLLTILEKQFDRIIIDTPSVNTGQESLAISRLSQGTILVVDGKNDPVNGVKKVVTRLKDADVHVLGTILREA